MTDTVYAIRTDSNETYKVYKTYNAFFVLLRISEKIGNFYSTPIWNVNELLIYLQYLSITSIITFIYILQFINIELGRILYTRSFVEDFQKE